MVDIVQLQDDKLVIQEHDEAVNLKVSNINQKVDHGSILCLVIRNWTYTHTARVE